MKIHFGPVYTRRGPGTRALCKPSGSEATMSSHWPTVTCRKCKGIGQCAGCGFAHDDDYKDCVWLKNPY